MTSAAANGKNRIILLFQHKHFHMAERSVVEGQTNFLKLPPVFNYIFPVASEFGVGNDVNYCHSTNGRTMLFGSEHTLKTPLLFQAAVSRCNTGEKTLYICPSPFKHLPLPVHGMPLPTMTNMNYLKLIYIDQLHNLMSYLTSFHEQESSIPVFLILDKLEYYMRQIKDTDHLEKRSAKLCALLQETVNFCSIKRQSRSELLVSCQKSDLSIKVLHVFSHFFQHIWHFHLPETYPILSKFSVTVNQLDAGNASSSKNLTICLKDNAIFLDKICKST